MFTPDTSTRDLLKALSAEERAQAIESALDHGSEGVRAWMEVEVARRFNFRPAYVAAMPSETLARRGRGLIPRLDELQGELLRSYLIHHQASMLGAYLDSLAIPHTDGVIAEGQEFEVDEAAARDAARRLLVRFDPWRVMHYLCVLNRLTPALVPGLDRWLDDLGPVDASPVDDALDTPSERQVTMGLLGRGQSSFHDDVDGEVEEPEARAEEPEGQTLTTLDELLIRAVVDTEQGVVGALQPDKLGDMVEEVVALNGSRHRSFFHLGFYDVLIGGEPRAHLPARNRSRERWYWAGAATAYARTGDTRSVVDLVDRFPVVRDLCGQADEPARIAAGPVFEAMVAEGRSPELADRLSPLTIADAPGLAGAVLEEATRLLRADRAPEARGLLERMREFADLMERRGVPPSYPFLLAVRRQYAHALRQMGESDDALAALLSILQHESDKNLQAMVLADVGLVRGGFQSMAHVVIPDDAEQAAEIARALERGRSNFAAGVSLYTRYSGHGHYCLGVLAMLQGKWAAAVDYLESALAMFEREVERYKAGGLYVRAHLYLGVAQVNTLDQVRVSRAAERVRNAVRMGGRVPTYLLDNLMEGLSLLSPAEARETTEALSEADPDFLERLPDLEVLEKSETLRSLMLARATDKHRPARDRARDLRKILPHFLASGDVYAALEVLDTLETLAKAGVGVEQFLTLLESSANHDPAWSAEDAVWVRVRLLQMYGRADEASVLLRGEFFRVLHSERYGAVEEAESILEAIEACGPAYARPADLERALAAHADQRTSLELPPEAHELARKTRVLFVGGDERQIESSRRIVDELEREAPQLEVVFELVGWGSNWDSALERITSRLQRYDAVVMMRYMRTVFGRRLRDELEIPWVHCATAGETTMKRSIMTAAVWGRRKRD